MPGEGPTTRICVILIEHRNKFGRLMAALLFGPGSGMVA
jgi:hypothetical protein